MEKKKNNQPFIVPASYFRNKGITPIKVSVPEKKSQPEAEAAPEIELENDIETELHEEELEDSIAVAQEPVATLPKIELNLETKRKSGLSLSSIKAKREHEIKQMEVVIDSEELPKEAFTEEQFLKAWNYYEKSLREKGRHNLASILSIDQPKLIESRVHLSFPNETNKVELEKHQYEILGFLRKKLKNYDIDFEIEVNEELEKQYVYSPVEKFQKLAEKNPNVELLRKTFKLDL